MLIVVAFGFTGCQTIERSTPFAVDEFGSVYTPYPRGSRDEFIKTLKQEYNNLASFEKDERQSEETSHLFSRKSSLVARGKRVYPEDPKLYDLPEFAERDLIDAYTLLADSINRMNVGPNKALLAVAQTRYDCWLVHVVAYRDRNIRFSCREDFYQSLKHLKVPDAYHSTYSIYFESNKAEISEEGMDVIEKVAHIYQGKSSWGVTLTGLTDSKGDRLTNQTLSLRRAVAVKNALSQYGVSLDDMIINAKGESDSSAQEIEDPKSRRVEIRFIPDLTLMDGYRDITESPGWNHIGG
jgi:outer membrane protein OmpA-like peptidoglycan-associated protein